MASCTAFEVGQGVSEGVPDTSYAWQLHQAGRFADAARCYQTLLDREPDHADALHLFGVLHYQNGYAARAAELIGRAVALQPGTAAFHANLAEVYRALGRAAHPAGLSGGPEQLGPGPA